MTGHDPWPPGPKIWWVEDFLSKEVIDNKHYSEKQEAVDRRNELGYGVVKAHVIKDV